MISTLQELNKLLTDYEWLESRLKEICATFMEGCPIDCVIDMKFTINDTYCYLDWKEEIYNRYECYRKPYIRKIPVDWLIKPHDEVIQAIWDILRKEREKEERDKKKIEKQKQKAKEDKERKVYEELKKKFERKKKCRNAIIVEKK